ncbi:hypothetical protein D9M70_516310 [compost metagenome]
MKPAKIRPEIGVTEEAQLASVKLKRTMPSRSNMPMIDTSDVSLKRPMKVLTMPGMTSFSACGSTMRFIFCQKLRPSESAPSYCPFGMACRPPRTTSAM